MSVAEIQDGTRISNSFRPDEMVSISNASKRLGDFVDSLRSKAKDKFLIVKNNVPEAVLLDVKVFEYLAALAEYAVECFDDVAISEELLTRMKDGKNHAGLKTLEEIAAENGIE